ncbi:tRNA lysidine(34) synthetase TilS [Flaviaesturariibacter flavus]|uniref:tRNA(Ile)-lysidine synthase n=1 Tax=Flaviaesturariibacter flavus TaxID=2502780 RepID=A0A4R1BH99_9BACT|nr:tRNA lysidine(34) synthetase TilS [Flaviaesturariibacter flavus]TCJ16544.1 tRNA lysidine(34) synthetase TilS [Flaviaesturariibacter flavus]
MDLFSRFIEYIKDEELFGSKDRLLLAVSGGLDSVVLTHLCRRAGFPVTLAHCNFGLRGGESDGDATFVRQLAETLGLPYFEKSFPTQAYALEQKLSIQEAARELRYTWFEELRLQLEEAGTGRAYLLTAHHLDDSIETLLINFFKGTGIAGLHGIRPKNGKLVRPLLFASRAELEAWAHAQGLRWREDRSNQDPKYTRNAVRLELLPAIERVFPGARANLAANIGRFAEVEQLYRASVDLRIRKMTRVSGAELRVPVRQLLKAEAVDTLLWELARPFGFKPGQVPGLRALLQSAPGRYLASGTHQAVRHGAWLLFAPLGVPDNTVFVIDKTEERVLFGTQLLQMQVLPAAPAVLPADPQLALLDAATLDYPLVLRRWKPGDYFYPLGMRKKKKVARFLIDSKLSKTQKEQVWVLESHKRIVWVVGHRIDDRFKITAHTRKAISVRVGPLSGPPNDAPGK